MAAMVALIAHVSIKPECVAEFFELANGMLAPSREEDACIAYDFFCKPENPSTLVFVEEWADRDGLEAHFQTPHFQEFSKKTGALTNKVDISIYHVDHTEKL